MASSAPSSGSPVLPFPDVELVAHIPWPDHPLGRYVRSKRKVELSRKELSPRPPADRRFTVYHELGHWWRTLRVPDRLVRGDADEEEFANAFAYFFLNREELAPGAHELFINGMSWNEERQISEFADRVVNTLEVELAEANETCGDCGEEVLGAHGACQGVPGGFGDRD